VARLRGQWCWLRVASGLVCRQGYKVVSTSRAEEASHHVFDLPAATERRAFGSRSTHKKPNVNQRLAACRMPTTRQSGSKALRSVTAEHRRPPEPGGGVRRPRGVNRGSCPVVNRPWSEQIAIGREGRTPREPGEPGRRTRGSIARDARRSGRRGKTQANHVRVGQAGPSLTRRQPRELPGGQPTLVRTDRDRKRRTEPTRTRRARAQNPWLNRERRETLGPPR